MDPRGFVGGSQLGFNYQIGNFVAGLEGDFEYVHLNGARQQLARLSGSLGFAVPGQQPTATPTG